MKPYYEDDHLRPWASPDEMLRRVVELLRPSLTDKGIDQWLHASNRRLGGKRPVDLLAGTEASRVVDAATSFAEGDYL
jgi:hypothetical protein